MGPEIAVLASVHRKRIFGLATSAMLLISLPLFRLAFTANDTRTVEVAIVAPQPVRPAVLASGRITHEKEVNLTSEVLGTVEAIHITEGQTVKKSQPVLTINGDAYEAEVVQHRAAVRIEEINISRQQARIANLDRHYERSLRLFNRNLLDVHSLEGVRLELELARIDLQAGKERFNQVRARLSQSESQLQKTRIRAPMDGVVTALDIKVGETAIASSTNIPGSRLMTIADPSALIAEVLVDEADIATVRIGQAVNIVPVAHPDKSLEGRVAFVANTARSTPRRRGLSFLARIRVAPEGSILLRPGMSCRAEIMTHQGPERLAAPAQAIMVEETPGEDDRHFVFAFRDGIARKLPVGAGRSDDTYQEITFGLHEGDRVVTGPGRTLRQLRDGDAIRLAAERTARPFNFESPTED